MKISSSNFFENISAQFSQAKPNPAHPAMAIKSDAIILLDCITLKIPSNVSENSDAIVLFYCIIHPTSLNML